MTRYPIYAIENFKENTFYNSLYVNSFKEHFKKHSFVEELHRHNFYLMVLFTNGKGKHNIDFKTFNIQPGSLFLMQPGQIHSWKLSLDIDGYIVFCSKEIFNFYFKNKQIENYPFFQSFKNSSEMLLTKSQMDNVVPYFKNIISENRVVNDYKKDKILNLLDCILIEIARIYSIENNDDKPIYNLKLNQFEAILEKNYKLEKSPSFYAGEMAITLKHLNRITKEILNKTITELITERVLLESKRLMVERQMSIIQIADNLGFTSPNYFMKLFKKHTGCTTKEFIKQLNV